MVTVDQDDAPVAVEVGTVRTVGGTRATVEVRFDALQPDSPPVAGTENEIFFEPTTPIAADTDGHPSCRVESSINKDDTDFVFLPPGCMPEVSCSGVRAFVLAVDNTDPIPDGSVLYRCTVQVAEHAPFGVYALRNTNVAASDPDGQPVDARAESGEVEVICAGDCDANGRVAIFEVLRGVNILLGGASASACPIFDIDGSETVQVNEIILAVSSALNGCTLTN